MKRLTLIFIKLVSIVMFSSSSYSEWTKLGESVDGDGKKVFTEFNPTSGEQDAYGLQKFQVITEMGKWLEIVGETCLGAFSQITTFDKAFQNAGFLWSGKCQVSDKILERINSYKKAE